MDNQAIADKAFTLLSKEPLGIGKLEEATTCKRRRLIRILMKDGRFQHGEKGVWSLATPKEDGPKVFKRRDSATTFLRKMGIAKDAYDQHIAVVDGGFQVTV